MIIALHVAINLSIKLAFKYWYHRILWGSYRIYLLPRPAVMIMQESCISMPCIYHFYFKKQCIELFPLIGKKENLDAMRQNRGKCKGRKSLGIKSQTLGLCSQCSGTELQQPDYTTSSHNPLYVLQDCSEIKDDSVLISENCYKTYKRIC